ncbi:MAG: XRE family transcriptional regulator [Bifidobacteriaceae bacterium]|jgi:Zn-dependent peptidase ImmA (M78 family)/transcriptional regulator with XRE-family HTH domain|nr:XRE family transcriptional regulator [Bifidobacteriaceae bacterium]
MAGRQFNGRRLVDLRDLLGISQASLAKRLGAGATLVSLVERGQRPLTAALARDIGAAFDAPTAFFEIPTTRADLAPVTFRKKAAASARSERLVVARHREAGRVFAAASTASGWPAPDLPRPQDHGGDPVRLAAEIRRRSGVAADEPIQNVTRVIERLGVGVLAALGQADSEHPGHLSISRPADAAGRPLIALIAPSPGDVARMSLAHELGHLIFDQQLAAPVESTRSREESRAYDFASALLVPDAVMRRHISESLPLSGYLPVKARYRVSVSALIFRARAMGLISEARARALYIQRSSQGWARREPFAAKPEPTALFSDCYDRAFPGWTNRRVAEGTGTLASLLDEWMPGHARPDEFARTVAMYDWRHPQSLFPPEPPHPTAGQPTSTRIAPRFQGGRPSARAPRCQPGDPRPR